MLNSNSEQITYDPEYELFKREFKALSSIDLDLYKEKQMKRRINTLIERKGLDGYESFLVRLRTDSSELDYFVDYITINVTEFFRTPDQWKYFSETVLAELAAKKDGKLKIWSSACSSGEEAYSLAIELMEKTDPQSFGIIASDIDEAVLNKAKQGSYDINNMESVPDAIKEKYFVRHGTHLVVKDILRNCVEFRKLDLLRDEYPAGCDLIVCRNVLIYFTDEGKEKVYRQFVNSLKTDGYLFTGNTEQIIYYKKYGIEKVKNYIYKK